MSENSIRLEEKVSSQSMVDQLIRKLKEKEEPIETTENPQNVSRSSIFRSMMKNQKNLQH